MNGPRDNTAKLAKALWDQALSTFRAWQTA